MKRTALMIASALMLGALANNTLANLRDNTTEKLREAHKVYLVTYPTGETERILVVYQGFHKRRQWQSGESASLTWKRWHPVDDRKCHWETSSWVQRKAYFLSYSGARGEIGDFEKVFETSEAQDAGPDHWYEVFYHQTCGDVRSSYLKDVNRSKHTLQQEFDTIVQKVHPQSLGFLKGKLKIVELQEQR